MSWSEAWFYLRRVATHDSALGIEIDRFIAWVKYLEREADRDPVFLVANAMFYGLAMVLVACTVAFAWSML